MPRSVPYKNYCWVSELIGNEKFHYLEPHHGKKFVDDMWDIGSTVIEHDNSGWTIRAEVYGGVDNWFRGQGEFIEVIDGGKRECAFQTTIS